MKTKQTAESNKYLAIAIKWTSARVYKRLEKLVNGGSLEALRKEHNCRFGANIGLDPEDAFQN